MAFYCEQTELKKTPTQFVIRVNKEMIIFFKIKYIKRTLDNLLDLHISEQALFMAYKSRQRYKESCQSMM